MPENGDNKKESIVMPDDLDRVNKDHLDLGNEKLVNEALREMAPNTFSDMGELTPMLQRLDERAKELIFEQKDSQEIVGQLVREEHERRKTELANMGRNVKTGHEEVPDPKEEAKAWKQYYREQKEARQADTEARAFDEKSFEDETRVFTEAADAVGDAVDAQAQEEQTINEQLEERYQSQLASDADFKQYNSVAPADTPEGKIEAVKARKHQEEQAIAQRNKAIKENRIQRSKLAREVDQMEYGNNDEWSKQQLDLDTELSKKSKKRQAAHTRGYTRKDMEKFGFEKPEDHVTRVKNERMMRQSQISADQGADFGVLTPEEYSRREQNRRAREEVARTGNDPRFEDPVNVQEEAPEGSGYKTHLDTLDAQAEKLQTFSENGLADWVNKLDKWKEGKDGLTIEEIRNEFPREALEAFDEIGYKNLPPEMRSVWSRVGAVWDSHERRLGLRSRDKKVYNDGVEAGTFIESDDKERSQYIHENQAYHREVVQARKDISERMEKIKHSDDPQLRSEYNNLARYTKELEKQDKYTYDSIHSMEDYKYHSDKLAEMNRAFVAGNLSVGEYITSPIVAGYHRFNMARHSYGIWERNALLENQQDNSGFKRWSMDKAIKTPRALAYTGLGLPVVAVTAAGALIWGAWKIGKFTWKKMKQIPGKGEKITKNVDGFLDPVGDVTKGLK